MKTNNAMKRILAFTVAFGLVLLLSSCNKPETIEVSIANTVGHTEGMADTPTYTGDVAINEEESYTEATSMFKETISPVAVNRPEGALIQKEGIVQIIIKRQRESSSLTYDIIRIYRAPEDSEAIQYVIESFNSLSLEEVDFPTSVYPCVEYNVLYNNGMEVDVRHGKGEDATIFNVNNGINQRVVDSFSLFDFVKNLP